MEYNKSIDADLSMLKARRPRHPAARKTPFPGDPCVYNGDQDTKLSRGRLMFDKKWVAGVPALLVAQALVCGALMSQSPWDPSTIEESFLEWSRSAPESGVSPFVAYLAKLKQEGRSDREVERARQVLNELFATRPEVSAILFDYIYTNPGAGYSRKPNALLAETVGKLPPGKALDVCMGQGRNAVFLAQLGWQVTGFDISAKGLEAAQFAAKKAGLPLRTIPSASETFDYGTGQWDLIVLSYAWGPFQDPAFIARLYASLRSGGLIVWEQYDDDDQPSGRGGHTANPVLKMFDRFLILRYENVMARPDWSPKGPVERITRLVAQKR